jgi:Tol biopolymer transport system component
MRRRWAVAATIVGGAIVALGASYYWLRDREPARDGAPSWFPDSRTIAFSMEVGRGKGDIGIMQADGSRRENLTNSADANDGSPAVSPDGRHIAFESERDGNVDIYLMDRTGNSPVRLTTDPAEDRSPAWSPDGSHLVFTSNRNNRASADLYVMKADGTGLDRLTSEFSNWAPQYSPDGRLILFQQNRDVHVLDLKTMAVRRLTFDPQNGMNPTWSPDARQIAFVTTRNGRAEIFVMNADGADSHVLVSMPSGNAIDPRWSPDGSRVAFVLVPGDDAQAGQGVQAIYTVEVGSGILTRLSR